MYSILTTAESDKPLPYSGTMIKIIKLCSDCTVSRTYFTASWGRKKRIKEMCQKGCRAIEQMKGQRAREIFWNRGGVEWIYLRTYTFYKLKITGIEIRL